MDMKQSKRKNIRQERKKVRLGGRVDGECLYRKISVNDETIHEIKEALIKSSLRS